MSVYVQYAPYDLRGGDWDSAREGAAADRHRDARASMRRGCRRSCSLRRRSRPPISKRTYGFTGGHIHHGELALDQLYVMRPLLGWAQHRTPIAGLYLCGAGTHPGGGHQRRQRRERRARGDQGSRRPPLTMSRGMTPLVRRRNGHGCDERLRNGSARDGQCGAVVAGGAAHGRGGIIAATRHDFRVRARLARRRTRAPRHDFSRLPIGVAPPRVPSLPHGRTPRRRLAPQPAPRRVAARSSGSPGASRTSTSSRTTSCCRIRRRCASR